METTIPAQVLVQPAQVQRPGKPPTIPWASVVPRDWADLLDGLDDNALAGPGAQFEPICRSDVVALLQELAQPACRHHTLAASPTGLAWLVDEGFRFGYRATDFKFASLIVLQDLLTPGLTHQVRSLFGDHQMTSWFSPNSTWQIGTQLTQACDAPVLINRLQTVLESIPGIRLPVRAGVRGARSGIKLHVLARTQSHHLQLQLEEALMEVGIRVAGLTVSATETGASMPYQLHRIDA